VRRCRAPLCAIVVAALGAVGSAQAQNPSVVSGVVLDESGGAIAGARIVVRGANGVVRSIDTDSAGAFSFAGLAPGTYDVQAAVALFEAEHRTLTIAPDGGPVSIRLTMRAASVREDVVVTGRRVEARRSETPQTIEVVDAVDIERSVAFDLTDLLKKNAGVDVVQYSGVLSGIGIRGFRPQFSGINKRSLLLVDGRPSGVTNLGTLLLDGLDRVEVLKGAASSVYGSSAMGGVVNVITKRSRGKVGGNARLGVGSFSASEFAGGAGGSLSSKADFDVAGKVFDQGSDFRMGNGVVRPATSYTTYNGSTRIGVDVSSRWRVDGRADLYRGRDIMTPGDVFIGVNSQGRKNLDRSTGDARAVGRIGTHEVSATAYTATESGRTWNVATTDPLDRPYLPYLTFEDDRTWSGAQLKDSWRWRQRNSLVAGLDYERVTSVSRSFARTGERIAPFSADSRKNTIGIYAENTLSVNGGRSVFTAGGRVDTIAVATLDTPLKTNFTPSKTTFAVFNPSVGFKQLVAKGLRAHMTAGRGFIPAEPLMLTGLSQTTVGGRVQITQGNPDLKPERSTSFDAGGEWSAGPTLVDVTYFQTFVEDRFISNVVISRPAAPAPIILSVANGLDSHIKGLDVDLQQRLGGHVGVFANLTHYISRTDRLSSGAEQNILNVPQNTIRAGVDVDVRRLSARVSGRYVQGRQDSNPNLVGSPIVDYDDFTVIDASARYALTTHHAVTCSVNNVFDAFYYEKLGFPLAGASFKLGYRLGF
jgi:vitamin B12 transporter